MYTKFPPRKALRHDLASSGSAREDGKLDTVGNKAGHGLRQETPTLSSVSTPTTESTTSRNARYFKTSTTITSGFLRSDQTSGAGVFSKVGSRTTTNKHRPPCRGSTSQWEKPSLTLLQRPWTLTLAPQEFWKTGWLLLCEAV